MKQCKAMETIESNERIATSIRLEADVYAAIAKLASEDDRPSQANMIERLLKTHPRMATMLEADTQMASAGPQ